MKCETCRWWECYTDEGDTDPAGVCKRYPPHANKRIEEAGRNWAWWPITPADTWCGEWAAKENS